MAQMGMSTRVYPAMLTVMTLCYYCGNPANEFHDRWETASWQNARHKLREHGLLDDNDKVTEKGRVWVEALCKVPFPVARWEIPTDV